MPLYDYENTKTGELVELYRPIAERDAVPAELRRFQVPCRIGLPFASTAVDPQCADVAVPRALKQMEITMGTRQLENAMGKSPGELKKIWPGTTGGRDSLGDKIE